MTLMKVLLPLLIVAPLPAFAFNTLDCTSDAAVVLKGVAKKLAVEPREFKFDRQRALEMQVSAEGSDLGQIFPWDHIVFQEAKPQKAFRDITFESVEDKSLSLKFTSKKSKKAYELRCTFSAD